MAKAKGIENRKKVVKMTCQGGRNPKTASMNKHKRLNYKPYRGQGR